VIGLDTNVLARYYVEDSGDRESQKQRQAARRLIESGQPLMVCKTVLLELEWVLRGHYGLTPADVSAALSHLLGLVHVTVEDRAAVERALHHLGAGFDFADALHHASYVACSRVASFDDRRFARRALRLGLAPAVDVPN
jgi:predicted nucleic-acid-binding protein